MTAILLIAALVLGGAFVVFRRRSKLMYTNHWRAPRISIYIGLILVAVRWSGIPVVDLTVLFLLVLTVGDIALGHEARKQFKVRKDLTFLQEIEAAWASVRATMKYGIRNVKSLLAPQGWGVNVNYENRAIKVISNMIDRSEKSTLFLIVIMYGSMFVLAILLVIGAGILSLTWVAADDSADALFLRKIGSSLLLIYGPYVTAVWLVSCILVGVFSMFLGRHRAIRERLQLFTYFAGATGVGAAVGLVAGILSPGVWNLVKSWGVFDSMLTQSPAISGDLALTCSSLGIIFGAIVGMYCSIRKYNRPVSNLVYREIATFGSIGFSAWVISLIKAVSPEEMLSLVLRKSSNVTVEECALEQNLKGVDVSDAARCMNLSDPSFFGSAADVFVFTLWVAGILGLCALILGFFRRLMQPESVVGA